MKMMVISAIGRESSSCYILAKALADMAENHGVEVDFVTPTEAKLPLNDGTIDWGLPEISAWRERVEAIQCHIWVSPEYHGAMTGAFKNLFDYLDKAPMRGDSVGLVALAGGGMAALNTLNGMSVLARSLGAWVAPDFCALNSDDVKDGLDERELKRLDRLVAAVIDVGRRLSMPWPDGQPA